MSPTPQSQSAVLPSEDRLATRSPVGSDPSFVFIQTENALRAQCLRRVAVVCSAASEWSPARRGTGSSGPPLNAPQDSRTSNERGHLSTPAVPTPRAVASGGEQQASTPSFICTWGPPQWHPRLSSTSGHQALDSLRRTGPWCHRGRGPLLYTKAAQLRASAPGSDGTEWRTRGKRTASSHSPSERGLCRARVKNEEEGDMGAGLGDSSPPVNFRFIVIAKQPG